MTSIDDVIRLLEAARDAPSSSSNSRSSSSRMAPKKKRKASPYQAAYGKAFKKLAPKHKTKKGAWKKGGFKRCQKAAHAEARRKTK